MHAPRAVLTVTLAALALPATAPAAPLWAQDPDRGAISGIVLDDLALTPLEGAVVEIVGTRVRLATAADGAFTLHNLRAGTLTLKVTAPGYVALTENVEVAPQERVLLQFRLPPVAAALEEMQVAVGALRTRPDHGTVGGLGRITSESSVLDMLARQMPGVEVRRGEGNSAPWIVIRGYSSVTQSNAPHVYVDGIRISTLEILQQIPAASVASIRVLRGSAADARFMDAANGVILVETMRGPGGDDA